MASDNSQEEVSVSNGLEFFLIPRSELPGVESQGYYRPESRGLAIIEKDGRLYEVPLNKVASAEQNGYRDLLSRERRKPSSVEPTFARLDSEPATRPVSPKSESLEPVTVTESQRDLAVPKNSSLIADAIARSKQLAEEVRLDQENQINEQVGWRKEWLRVRFWINTRRAKLCTQFGATGVSVVIHVAMILILASFYLSNNKKQERVILASPSLADSLVEAFSIEHEQIEIKEPTGKDVSDASSVKEVVPEVTNSVDTPNFLAAVNGQAIKMPPGAPKSASIPGEGMGNAKGKPTIFGSKFAAISYVFVIDNSNSMSKGRFETALIQLMLTVNQLTPKQRFYVIFYSDTAYEMMHPNMVSNLVPATPQNKLLLGKWLNTVPLCLRTNGRKAIQAAIDLKPDMIYILGDGAFTDNAAEYFASKPHPSIVINTIGMEVDAKDAKQFMSLATSHRGKYIDVGVMPEGAKMAAQYPRPANRVRGPVWGITLPPEKK